MIGIEPFPLEKTYSKESIQLQLQKVATMQPNMTISGYIAAPETKPIQKPAGG